MSDGADGRSDGDGSTDDGSNGDRPGDTMGGRVTAGRASDWFLMNGSRRLAAGLIAVVFFGGLVLVGRFSTVPVRSLVSNKNALWWVFSPMIGAVVTGVTLVVTIGQLILSQELGALGDQRERMEGSIEFRTDVESWLDEPVSPADPASFMGALLDAVRDRSAELGDAAAAASDADVGRALDDYADAVRTDAARVGDTLDDATFGRFEVMVGTLNFNYSWKLHQGRRLLKRHGDALDDGTRDLLDGITRLLRFFGPAREHFKTLYFQWELVNLSRVMLITAVPALFVAVAVQLYANGSTFPGATLGVENLAWFLAACVTLTLLPFFFLLTYVIRVATVTKRTLAIGPFVLRNTDRNTIDWE